MIDQAYLESIGVTDADTIKQITETYTTDIQAEQHAKSDVQTQLDEASKTIQSYKDMDIDGIKASVEDYKQKLAQAEADRAAFEHRTKLNQYVKGLHLRDDICEKYVADLLNEKGLKFDGDKLIGGDDVVQEFRKTHENAFAPNPNEQTATPTGQRAPKALTGVEAAFYAKNPGLKPETK